MTIKLATLRFLVDDQLGIGLRLNDLYDLHLMLRREDHGSIVEFFDDRTDGGLTRDGHTIVRDLVADFGGED